MRYFALVQIERLAPETNDIGDGISTADSRFPTESYSDFSHKVFYRWFGKLLSNCRQVKQANSGQSIGIGSDTGNGGERQPGDRSRIYRMKGKGLGD